MKFGDYLKTCRNNFGLTQEELVTHLYHFHDLFDKLDVGTLSRWERNITCPNLQRQKFIIKSFQHYSDDLFPYYDLIDMPTLMQKTAAFGITKIIGKHKRYILDFPADLIENSRLQIFNMKTHSTFKSSLKLSFEIHKKMTQNFSHFTFKNFENWASHPKSLFLLASYEDHFFGMLFSLRLKEDIVKKLLSQQMKSNQLTLNDFADDENTGTEYLISFFSYSEESATLLSLSYYDYLAKHQHEINTVATLMTIPEGHALVKTLGLKSESSITTEPQAYRATLQDVLLNPYALSMFFEKHIS